MTYDAEFQRAKEANQAHIFSFYHQLTDDKKDHLVRQVKNINYV